MDFTLTLIIIAIGVVILFLLLRIASRLNSPTSHDEETLRELQKQEERLERTRKEVNELLQKQNELLQRQMSETNRSMQQNFAISQKAISETQKETSQIVKSVTEKLTILEKTNEQVVDFAKQMESLEKILKNPKQRGILGEYFLETTLKNVLPPESYKMQYKFKDGEIVDAVVFVKDKIIPVDSKFSLENYNRIIESEGVQKEALEKQFKQDLKNRIDETSKYIRPAEGTMDFAFMFIPSEGIYYDLLINKVGTISVNTQDLISYAFAQKNVIIVSPTSFLAYLQTVLQGLRALQIEESAKMIRDNVGKLSVHLKAYEEYFDKLGKNLSTTVNFYNKATKEFKKVDKDVMKITGDSMELGIDEISSIDED